MIVRSKSYTSALLGAFLLLGLSGNSHAQSTLLQSGPFQQGHVPMYVGQGSFQPVVIDSGPAGGGAPGVGLTELGLTIQGTGTGPFANAGSGPLNTNFCDYDAPTSGSSGYHYFCASPNAQGGGLIAVGAGGGASTLPLNIIAPAGLLLNGAPITGTGTITGVTAGTGLSGGGTTGVVTLNIANTISGAGPIGGAGTIPIITYNSQGQLTAVSTATTTVGCGGLPAFTGDVTTSAGTCATAVGSAGNAVIYASSKGAKCDGSTDDTVAIQAAITAAEASGGIGLIVQLPSGFCRTSATMTIAKGMRIVGSGSGSGSGSGNSGGTVIRASNLTTDVFAVASDGAVSFENFRIDTTGGYGSVGAAISLTGATSTGNQYSKIDNMLIADTFDGVRIDNASGWIISNTEIVDYGHDGVYGKYSSSCVDGCGAAGGRSTLVSDILWDLNRGTSNAGLEIGAGGDIEVIGSKFLASAYGIELNLTQGPTGTLLISANSLEEQKTATIALLQATSGKEYANVTIVGNELSSLSNIPTNGNFYVGTGTPTTATKWIRNITFDGNVFNDAVSTSISLINILDGTGIIVGHNLIDNNTTATATGISCGATATNVSLFDNAGQALPGGLYGTLSCSPVISDGGTYAPLLKTGGTLSGALLGTTGSFSGSLTAGTGSTYSMTLAGAGAFPRLSVSSGANGMLIAPSDNGTNAIFRLSANGTTSTLESLDHTGVGALQTMNFNAAGINFQIGSSTAGQFDTGGNFLLPGLAVSSNICTTSSRQLTTSCSAIPYGGAIVDGAHGGTGVANTGKTVTLGGNLTTSGAFATTLTVTGATGVTLPTSGTLATTAALPLTGTTSAIGGGSLMAGECASGTVTVAGATTGMAVSVSPAAQPLVDSTHGLGIWAFVSSSNTVTVDVCAIVSTTPNSVAYNVRVIQ